MDRLDRLYAHLIQPDDLILSNEDDLYLKKLRKAYNLIHDEISQSKAISKILETVQGAQTNYMARRIFTDCKRLYGNFIVNNKSFDRAILKERLAELAARAKIANEYETERLCYVNLIRLDGLDQHENKGIDPAEIQLPDFIITSDPKALNQGIEETPFEDA